MKTFLIVVTVLFALVVTTVGWLVWRAHAGGRTAYRQLLERIAPVHKRLAVGQDPDPADLERFAADRETRTVLFDTLEHANKLALFPKRWLTHESMAEADLVAWLRHPNELGAPPSDIELVATVPAPTKSAEHVYHVFRYRVNPPHWNADKGWMAGVAGPYDPLAPVTAHARGTFSRFETFESRTPEEHVRLVHDQIVGR